MSAKNSKKKKKKKSQNSQTNFRRTGHVFLSRMRTHYTTNCSLSVYKLVIKKKYKHGSCHNFKSIFFQFLWFVSAWDFNDLACEREKKHIRVCLMQNAWDLDLAGLLNRTRPSKWVGLESQFATCSVFGDLICAVNKLQCLNNHLVFENIR